MAWCGHPILVLVEIMHNKKKKVVIEHNYFKKKHQITWKTKVGSNCLRLKMGNTSWKSVIKYIGVLSEANFHFLFQLQPFCPQFYT